MTVRFNPSDDFILRKTGEPFDKFGVSERELRLLYQKRVIVHEGVNRSRRSYPPPSPSAPVVGAVPTSSGVQEPLPADVFVPDDWRDLAWPKLWSLARQVSDEPIHSKLEAIAAIESYLDQ